MVHNLTRGLGLLEEAEFNSRRDAEQMVKTIADFRDALNKIQNRPRRNVDEGKFQHVELTRALTTIENARMEWNSARLKLPALAGESAQKKSESEKIRAAPPFRRSPI
jgi:hypothetical protein